MATKTRRGPTRTDLERMESMISDEKISPSIKDDTPIAEEDERNAFEVETGYIDLIQTEDGLITKTPSVGTITPGRDCTSVCDTCKITKNLKKILYCWICKQKLCDLCLVVHNRLGGTRNHYNSTEKCWPESEVIEKSVLDRIMKEQKKSVEKLASDIQEDLGMQICHLYDEDMLELRAPATDVLEVAVNTVNEMAESTLKESLKRVRKGAIEWKLQGRFVNAITKLFKDQLRTLIDTYDVTVDIKHGSRLFARPTQKVDSGIVSNNVVSNDLLQPVNKNDIRNVEMELIIKANFDNYYAVDCEIDGIIDEVNCLFKAEVLRPKQDEFRMKLYTMMKEKSGDVICHVEKLENVYKLVIQGQEESVVEEVRQEFLSLFCKECSSCHEESSRPTYLECKHVLCHKCVNYSASLNDGLACPRCSDITREKTPVSSLQLTCIQVIDNLIDKTSTSSRPVGITRRQSSFRTPQLSTKIPKYLLNKWKKMTGGLSRLKSMIENTYGFKVAGTEDNMKIYGQQPEILDLAVLSLEKLNEKTPETGISVRLAEKCVEWRLRGDHARIAHFLFNKELYDLKKKFKTVALHAFTESEPMIVDVKCGYVEFQKVKYEMEELENDIKNIYTDECVQPKNFYHNVKIREYLQSKRRDDKVHCSLVDKNNLNVVVIRGRKKELVNAAKEQLLKW